VIHYFGHLQPLKHRVLWRRRLNHLSGAAD